MPCSVLEEREVQEEDYVRGDDVCVLLGGVDGGKNRRRERRCVVVRWG